MEDHLNRVMYIATRMNHCCLFIHSNHVVS